MAPYPPSTGQRPLVLSPSNRVLGTTAAYRASSRESARWRGATATSWAPPAAARVAAAREPVQEGLSRDAHAQSFVHLPSAPALPRSYSTFASQGQLASAVGEYVAARAQQGQQQQQQHCRPQAAASVPAPLPLHLSRRPASSVEVLRPANRDLSADGEDAEYSEPREDLEGLLEYFEGLAERGVRLTEVAYVVNTWTLGGVIPLWHHGFILQAEDEGYLTLDFSRRGILWDTFDTYPDLPESTIFVKKYSIDTDPERMKCYCKETKPFSWHSNDCQHWARGVMRVMRIMENPLDDRGAFKKPGSLECLLCGGGKSLEKRVLPTCMQ